MQEPFVDLRLGDVHEVLRSFPADYVQTVITSPPYWGLRNYSAGSQEIGSEPTFEQHVDTILDVMAEVKRVLRPDGTVWFNYGDRYNTHNSGERGKGIVSVHRETRDDWKNGDLIGMPWEIAFALRDQGGWILRSDIVWHKNNPMPESITDRPTRAHEFLFLLAKNRKYFYDHEAIKEPYAEVTKAEAKIDYHGQDTKDYSGAGAQSPSSSKRRILESIKNGTGRNKRDVWQIPVQPYKGGHFATFPEALVEPCVLAGSSGGGQCRACGSPYRRVVEREPIPDEIKRKFEDARAKTARDTGRTDGHTNYKPNFRRATRTTGWEPGCECGAGVEPQIVLDPFLGSGRAGIVARRLGRSFIGSELNEDYLGQAWGNILSVEPPQQDEEAA
jgi:DNA modification methylase